MLSPSAREVNESRLTALVVSDYLTVRIDEDSLSPWIYGWQDAELVKLMMTR